MSEPSTTPQSAASSTRKPWSISTGNFPAPASGSTPICWTTSSGYLFLNTFRITDAQRAFIEKRLKQNNKVLVFIYAPGYTDEHTLSANRVSEITGFNIDMLEKETPLRVTTGRGSNPITKYLGNTVSYGSFSPIGPVFIPKNGESIGSFEGIAGSGLVMAKHPGWTSIYSAAPVLPAALLRGIAEYAGITVANPEEGDITFAGDRITAIHTLYAGNRTIAFPQRTGRVRELIMGTTYPLIDGRATVTVGARSTSIFMWEPR
jgi:hypothetical protein